MPPSPGPDAEAVAVYKGLWGPEPFSFAGEHYRIEGLDGKPKPVQQPHPPLLIGGGRPRVLSLAGREADIVGLNPALPKGYIDVEEAGAELSPAAVERKVGWVRDAAGERFPELELNILVFLAIVGPDAGSKRDQMAQMFNVPLDQFDASPYVWVGDTHQVADQLRSARERWGTSYFVVQGERTLHHVAPLVAELAGT